MKRDLFINELKNIKLIAHRLGYQMTRYPENSMEVLEEIFSDRKLLDTCDGFEFDICFTSDKIPIVVHDKYVDDISDHNGMFRDYTYEKISNFKFKFRKTLNKDNDFYFRVITLDEILCFFDRNRKLLDDKIIRIETKDFFFKDDGGLEKVADILNKYPNLNKNIVHICFWPFNLKILKDIQLKKKYKVSKTDLLCDYSIVVSLAKFMKYIDGISLRIKTNLLPVKDKSYSKMINKKISSDLLCMKFSNTIKERIIKNCIEKYGSVNLYTLNDNSEIEHICSHISDEFFLKYKKKIEITTNEPNKYK